jgi:hypothetical protein
MTVLLEYMFPQRCFTIIDVRWKRVYVTIPLMPFIHLYVSLEFMLSPLNCKVKIAEPCNFGLRSL